MDRFKFRVWWKSPYTNVSSKYLYYDPHENNYRTDIIRDADCDFAEDIIYYDLRDIILGNIDEYERPGTFTVEQCTGLKDKNGNLIYEGDVVKCDRDFNPDGRVGLIRKVVFDDGAFKLSNDNDSYFISGFHNIEILGNKHEQKDNK